jgi:Fe-S-cluster containining protein
MIKFSIHDDLIELDEYSPDVTLSELAMKLDAFRSNADLKTKKCPGCGECCSDNIPVLGYDLDLYEGKYDDCLIMPEKPDVKSRKKAIDDLLKNSMSLIDATLIYEYNNSEPIILNKKSDGECIFLKGGFCGSYRVRPYSCGLYLCVMGEKLSYIEEMIIRQGTWHAYNRMGWIDESEIRHNPFLKTDSYCKLLVKDFDSDLKGALDSLFFYF